MRRRTFLLGFLAAGLSERDGPEVTCGGNMNLNMADESKLDHQLLRELIFEVAIEGQKYPVGQPSPGLYRGEDYGWDPEFFTHSLLAVGEQNLAIRMLDGNAAKIKSAGYLPLVARWDSAQHDFIWKLRTKGDPRFTAETQQPLVAQTALRLLREEGLAKLGRERVRHWAEAGQTHLDWLRQNRRAPGRTLFSIIDPIESGEDSLSAWDEIAAEKGWPLLPRTLRIFWLPLKLNLDYTRMGWDLGKIFSNHGSVLIEPVSLNVFAIREARALAVLWRKLGENDRAKADEELASDLSTGLEKELWNEPAGAYFPTARFATGWRQMPIFSVENLYPLLLPNLPVGRVGKLVQLIEHQFVPGAKRLLPVAPVDPQHPQKVAGVIPIWWPGQVWANCNWFFRDALRYWSEKLDEPGQDSARKIAERIDQDWYQLKQSAGYAEFYTQEGTGGAEKKFFWSCLRRAKFAIELR